MNPGVERWDWIAGHPRKDERWPTNLFKAIAGQGFLIVFDGSEVAARIGPASSLAAQRAVNLSC